MPVRFQVVAVILGLLVYQTMLLGLFERYLPNERHYLALREETDRLLALVRDLNQAAIAAEAARMDRQRYLAPIVRRMHETVDRLPTVAGRRMDRPEFRPWLDEGGVGLDERPGPEDQPRVH
jgi:hypothetical protein